MSIIAFLVLWAGALVFIALLVGLIGAIMETVWNRLRRDDYNETWTS